MNFLKLVFPLFAFVLFSCGSETDSEEISEDSLKESAEVIVEEVREAIDSTVLSIEGNDIWIRSKPFTGDVVMKLNTGDQCKVIEKGDIVQLRDMLDRWYKIEFDGKTGWVFGSQTNFKTGEFIKIENFEIFLKDYIEAFNDVKLKLKKFANQEVDYVYMFNPGIYCAGSQDTHDRYISEPISTNSIYKGLPNGDFCEGFPGVKDGFYFKKINKKQLPTFVSGWDDDGNIIMGTIEIPDKYSSNTIYKVQVITDEFHNSYHYFINIGKGWYLICEDHCDCSA